MKKFTLLAFAAIAIFSACRKDVSPETNLQPKLPEEKYYKPDLAQLTATDRAACDWTEIPAGSVNALANAIANTCPGGVIYLRSGLHTENARVVVNKSVKIIGETGAVLKLNTAFSNFDANGAYFLHPGLHVLDAANVLVQNLDIQPTGTDGGTVLFVENSPSFCLLKCKITNFQYGVWLHKSDRAAIIQNHIKCSGLWRTGGFPEAIPVTIANGKSAYIADNDLENGNTSFFASDQWGTAERNNCHGSGSGIILCKVYPDGYNTPSGAAFGAEQSANYWKISQNTCTGNADNGIILVDGAHHNHVWGNQVHGNGLAPITGVPTDIEIFADSHMFGFFTPESHDNFVDASSDPATTIRNCGTGNTIVGGQLVVGGCR